MKTQKISQEEIKKEAPLLPNYYCKALAKLQEITPLDGLRVLEIGGYSVPKFISNDLLGAQQWVSVDILDFVGGVYQTQKYSDYTKGRPIFKLGRDKVDWDNPNIIIDGDALEFSKSIDQKFDVIFSVNCFEHMPKLVTYLSHARSNLTESGILFTQFGPIWSCCNGNHVRLDNEIDFSRPGFLDKFQHLLLSRSEMINHLKTKGIDRPRAEQAAFQIYNSHVLNRYTYDDYIYSFKNSGFSDIKIISSYEIDVPEDLLRELKVRHPNISNFSTYELTVKCSA
jgi:SAM-dependent methyltransferase